MTQPPLLDPERLAALLDGRLSNAEAAVVRAQLASADDAALAMYADVVAVVSELDEQRAGEPARVIPMGQARRMRWLGLPVALIAAGVLGVVFVKGYSGTPALTGSRRPVEYASALPSTVVLPGAPVWGVTRGAQQAVSETGRYVRLGALSTDMGVVLAHDDTASAAVAEAMASYLDEVPGAGSVASALRAAARATMPTRKQDLRRLAQQGIRFADEPFMRAGAWLEALRLAPANDGSAFLRQFPADNALGALLGQPGVGPAVKSELRRLISISNVVPADRAALTAGGLELLKELAR